MTCITRYHLSDPYKGNGVLWRLFDCVCPANIGNVIDKPFLTWYAQKRVYNSGISITKARLVYILQLERFLYNTRNQLTERFFYEATY